MRFLKVPKGVLRLIAVFPAVDACEKHPLLDKYCFYQKSVNTKRYVLRVAKFISGISF